MKSTFRTFLLTGLAVIILGCGSGGSSGGGGGGGEGDTVQTPVITPSTGTFNSAQQITISCATSDAEIFYTLDGSTPGRSSPSYTAPFNLSTTTTVTARAFKDGMTESGTATATLTFGTITHVADPVLAPAKRSFAAGETAVLSASCATDGAVIRYTLNESEPTAASTEFPATLNLSSATFATKTVKLKAFKSGLTDSATVTETFTFYGSTGFNYPATGAFSPVTPTSWSTATWKLGAHYDSADVTFAVYSKNATKVLLEIYDTETSLTDTGKGYGSDARFDIWMEKNSSDNIWRAKLKDVPEKTYYAFRVWGPNWTYSTEWRRGNSSAGFVSDVDDNGNRFNPNKVIFDPYAREISHDKEFPAMYAAGESGGMFGTGGSDTIPAKTYSGTLTTGGTAISSRNVDTGRWVPKGIILKPITTVFTKPTFTDQASVIYEAHVRGITAHSSASSLTTILNGMNGFSGVVNVPELYRGTYKGAGYLAKYLKSIGVNVIELLPVHETENDMMPLDGSQPTLGGAKNFWGYMTYGFFAPDRRYAHDKSPGGPTKEFQEMVQAFNAEGIKVFLDVVYNHTGEGGNWGHKDVTGFVSMGGFDCAEYYHLVPGGPAKNQLVDGATGCGNQLNFSRTVNHNLVLDSLTYWIDTMGINGFRFDLGAVLGRKPDDYVYDESDLHGTTPNQYPGYWDDVKAFHSDHPTLTAIAALGADRGAWMIAEAWDLWGYPVGEFPNGWGEWNGRYRDAIRHYMMGNYDGHDGVKYRDAFNGDYDHFENQGGPHKSINFLVAHDGFTLADLVSYNTKQNTTLSWPFGPSDGGNDTNLSWDSGGDKALRRQRLRNFWTYQMFSRGTPMVVYGDELTRTQNGNNNPYNIDSVMTWNNYSMINTDSPQAVATGGGGAYHNNLGTDANADSKNTLFLFASNIMKLRRDTTALHDSDYSQTIDFTKEDGNTIFAGDELAVRIRRGNFLICSNMAAIDVNFQIPAPGTGKRWVRIIDTHSWAEKSTASPEWPELYTTVSDNMWSVTDANAWNWDEDLNTYNSFKVRARSIVVFQLAND